MAEKTPTRRSLSTVAEAGGTYRRQAPRWFPVLFQGIRQMPRDLRFRFFSQAGFRLADSSTWTVDSAAIGAATEGVVAVASATASSSRLATFLILVISNWF